MAEDQTVCGLLPRAQNAHDCCKLLVNLVWIGRRALLDGSSCGRAPGLGVAPGHGGYYGGADGRFQLYGKSDMIFLNFGTVDGPKGQVLHHPIPSLLPWSAPLPKAARVPKVASATSEHQSGALFVRLQTIK